MRLIRALSICVLLVFLSIFTAHPLFGQTPDSTGKDFLKTYHHPEELVVIGARGEKKLLKLPMAVSVVEAEGFSKSRKAGLNEALQAVPGVFAQSRAGGRMYG